jgi:hypothetical protein
MDQLILVDHSRLHHARIEGVPWQCRRRFSILLEHLADRLVRAIAIPLAVCLATSQQIRIQFVEISNLRHRRRPSTLKRLDPVLHIRLLIASGRHAKQRIEHVVARQRRITRMQPTLATGQQFRGHRLGIVPPDFSRHTTEILEAADHPFENRFRSLRRQRYGKRAVRVRPDQNQHPHGQPALGKIHVDLSEIGLQTLSRIVRQRDERLSLLPTTLRHVTPHCIVAAFVPLARQSLEDPHCRVALFPRRLVVCRENLVDEAKELPQLPVMLTLPLRIRRRLTIPLENCPNLPTRVMKSPGDLANAHPIAIRPANPCVMIHRKHPILRKLAKPPSGN